MRIAELVRTYRLLSDPEAPPWSVRFRSSFLIAVVVAAGVATAWHVAHKEPRENRFAASVQEEADGSRTAYVGYDLDAFQASLGYDRGALGMALAQWERAHPDVVVLAQEPVHRHGLLLGYQIRYAP